MRPKRILLALILAFAPGAALHAQEPEAGAPPAGLVPWAASWGDETDDDVLREAVWTRVASSKPPARPSVGLALSGGGARGFAHAGVLEALEYAGFPVDEVSGTSMGSVIGSLYAAGTPVQEIWKFGREAERLKISRDFRNIRVLGLLLADKLLTPTHINEFIESHLGGKTFADLRIPFACSAMDLRTGEKIVFTEGPLAIAVRASVDLPGIFAPVQYRHRYLVDGGVVDFIPVEAAKQLGAEWVLASVTSSSQSRMPENVLMSLLQVIDIRGSLLAGAEEKEAGFVFKPELGGVGVADFDKCEDAGEVGLLEASRRMNEAKEALLIYSAPRVVEKL
ncbi:MAG: patatin-like phospholipase family protein [Elusimicrobia bacterium]|nr:patatin-like phospholipase family protein [Elusimicrobiota bacterium]